MPELPEIWNLARQMAEVLPGSAFVQAEVDQPKCLNLPLEQWRQEVLGRRVLEVRPRGKWIDLALEEGAHLRVNLGMGGEVLLHEAGEEPAQRRRALLTLADGRRLSVNFWWFGSLHALAPGQSHAPWDKLGPDAISASPELLEATFGNRRSPVKALLLRQDLLSGVGNYYIHDILFRAGLHPTRPGNTLSGEEFQRLARALEQVLGDALAAGGADYERDLYNRLGGYSATQVGYREGQPCPVCGQTIVAMRVGQANSYFCPQCQR